VGKATPRRCLGRRKKGAKAKPFNLTHTLYPCPLHFALCLVLFALCSLLFALCPLPLPLSKTIGVVKMLLACKDVDAKKSTEAGTTPSHVAREFGHEYIFDLLSGCMDHNHDILARGTYPRDGEDHGFGRGAFEDTKDQDSETQWNGNLKQNLERSAIISPVENGSNLIISSVSKAIFRREESAVSPRRKKWQQSNHQTEYLQAN
jgi:hypothetical protein